MNNENDKYFTELDKDLQHLAMVDWPAFVQIVGFENIKAAKVCILKSRGKSLRQTSYKLDISKRQAEYACKKCPN